MDTIAEQKRRASYINLDPAAEEFTWEPTIGMSLWEVEKFMVDIRDLVSLEDVMEELDLGPNGGLIYCFECYPPVTLSLIHVQSVHNLEPMHTGNLLLDT